MRSLRWLIVQIGLPLAVIYAFPWVFNNGYYIHMAQTFLITYIVIVGLNLLVGLSHQLSLGHVGFYAIGAYLTAIIGKTLGLNFFVSILLGSLVAAAFGAVVALLSLRSKGPYLAMVTIAFGELIGIISNRWIDVTGGPAGYFPNAASFFGYTLQPYEYMWFIGLLAVLFTAGISNIFKGRFGRTFTALGNSEVASEVLGVNVRGWKILLAISAFMAGAGGGLFAHQNGFISSSSFEFHQSILFITGVIIGGAGTKWGPVVGTAIIVLLPQWFSKYVDYHLFIFGGILLLCLLLLPNGVVGELSKLPLLRKWLGRGDRNERKLELNKAAPLMELPEAKDGTILELGKIRMQFGGLKAVDDVDIEIKGGTVHGIIGPNGSGKSTMVNVLSGVYMPTGGSIVWQGKNITKFAPHQIAKHGITRTFQNLQLFNELTVIQNVLIGFHRHFRSGFLANLVHTAKVSREEKEFYNKAYDLLRIVGLEDRAHETAADLSYGEQRLVEVARGLALQPSLLILDEPAAGASNVEIDKINDVIRRLKKSGLSIILVEHHMEIVMNICDTITVLDFGKKLCEGTPEFIQNHPKVIEAYLGGEEVNELVRGKKSIG
ncbi:ABC transporter [Cohnella kolymensis]|uniref:ABC transporter n=1 Tax=Cohnella kolymensis TaxID=1590652 RepID=A0ABR5A3Q0_9BACL|nr:branched-chain amino acid ABC transporter ATP-binding protein/permease [Cohnella kolymensis]KIL35572.1 ABC transporter [Cohnella kolymensis]